MPPLQTARWYGKHNRPDWAGKVTLIQETVQHVRLGPITRTTEVYGIVAPGATKDRPSAPEPSVGIRVGMEKRVPARYRFDPSTGRNFGNDGFPDAEKGHLMALELGGPDIPENIVPQWAKWQGSGVWRTAEKEVLARALKGDPEGDPESGYLLQFHCLVRYPAKMKVEWAGLRRVCTPKGFCIAVTRLSKKTKKPLDPPEVIFDEDQDRNESDEMLAMRAFQRVDGPDMEYDDWEPSPSGGKEKKRKRKAMEGRFVSGGQNPLWRPPPISFSGGDFDLSAYALSYGIRLSLDEDCKQMLIEDPTYEPDDGEEEEDTGETRGSAFKKPKRMEGDRA